MASLEIVVVVMDPGVDCAAPRRHGGTAVRSVCVVAEAVVFFATFCTSAASSAAKAIGGAVFFILIACVAAVMYGGHVRPVVSALEDEDGK